MLFQRSTCSVIHCRIFIALKIGKVSYEMLAHFEAVIAHPFNYLKSFPFRH